LGMTVRVSAPNQFVKEDSTDWTILVLAAWASLEFRDLRCHEKAHLSDDETVAKMGHPVLWL
jgi:hypothetical protein